MFYFRFHRSGTSRAVWTGSQLAVTGSASARIMRYFPGSNNWVYATRTGAASDLEFSDVLWIGSELLVLTTDSEVNIGDRRYNPTSDSWQPINPIGRPAGAISFRLGIGAGSEAVILYEVENQQLSLWKCRPANPTKLHLYMRP